MYDIPGRPVISNYGFYTENVFFLLDLQLKSIPMQVQSYMKEVTIFLKNSETSQIYQKNL